MALAFAASSAHAAEIAIFPVHSTNLTPEQSEALGAVLAQQYAKISGKDVLDPDQVRQALGTDDVVPSAAQALGVREYIETTAVALNSKLLVSATRRFASGGGEIHRAQMEAASLDDFVEVADRMARALVEKVSTDDTRTLDNITKLEAQPKNRLRPTKALGIKTALGIPLPATEIERFVTLGFDGRFDLSWGFLEFGAGALIPADSGSDKVGYGGIYAEFGANFYLLNRSFAPYLGLGVSPRIVWGGGSNVNLLPYAQAGVARPDWSRSCPAPPTRAGATSGMRVPVFRMAARFLA
ncbi:MAG TPA: hypothetical protein VMK12_12055 [Anaeromyxobacteraceae bacterium]|nr:hypothetical protein [Anaeromyxobacteraceae bacterium]